MENQSLEDVFPFEKWGFSNVMLVLGGCNYSPWTFGHGASAACPEWFHPPSANYAGVVVLLENDVVQIGGIIVAIVDLAPVLTCRNFILSFNLSVWGQVRSVINCHKYRSLLSSLCNTYWNIFSFSTLLVRVVNLISLPFNHPALLCWIPYKWATGSSISKSSLQQKRDTTHHQTQRRQAANGDALEFTLPKYAYLLRKYHVHVEGTQQRMRWGKWTSQ